MDRDALGAAAVELADGAQSELLQVALYGVGIADLRLVGILPDLRPRSSLPKEIPAAIKLDLHRPQPLLVCLQQLFVFAVALFAVAKLVLLVDEALDPRRDALVAHELILVRVARRAGDDSLSRDGS